MDALQRARRTIRILKLKLIIARHVWTLDQGTGSEAAIAERETKAAEAKLTRMKLTKREQAL
jgi:hypothetical protein